MNEFLTRLIVYFLMSLAIGANVHVSFYAYASKEQKRAHLIGMFLVALLVGLVGAWISTLS